MVFSSQIFLFFFLPVTLILYYSIKNTSVRNMVLLVMSVFFYWYGVRSFILVILLSVVANWFIAKRISLSCGRTKKFYLAASVVWNLSILVYYKYLNFIMDNISKVTGSGYDYEKILVPVGLSFVTFQAMSYCFDVYLGKARAQSTPFNVALYITLFPQLIAGPIVKFQDIEDQISVRHESLELFNEGVTRFIYGLGKKVIIANVLGNFVDDIYAMDPASLSMLTAWVGSIGYTLQIYFAISGYSEMAIGLGKMFGFHFRENFDYPYMSRSISEFWRRWHISLGNWFREYVYIPLGGNRKGLARQIVNLLIVWLLTGIWHGANWTFIFWGVSYGAIIIIERLLSGKFPKVPAPVGWIYTFLIFDVLFVFFRSDSISFAVNYLGSMFGAGEAVTDGLGLFYLRENAPIMIAAILISFGAYKYLNESEKLRKPMDILRPWILIAILVIAVSYIVKGSYDPFIYFNF